jgi:cytochrome bd-type quinol oxidase subunit 2
MLTVQDERSIARRIRLFTSSAFVLGTVIAIIGYIPNGIIVTDNAYRDHSVALGANWLLFYLLLLLLPGILVLQKPRHIRAHYWRWWAILCSAVSLFILIRTIKSLCTQNENIIPSWPAWAVCALMPIVVFLIAIVIPNASRGR